jgi:hypothetical protein
MGFSEVRQWLSTIWSLTRPMPEFRIWFHRRYLWFKRIRIKDRAKDVWTDGSLDRVSKARKTCRTLHQDSRHLIDERLEKKFPICWVSYLSAQIFQEPKYNKFLRDRFARLRQQNSQLVVEDAPQARYHHDRNNLEWTKKKLRRWCWVGRVGCIPCNWIRTCQYSTKY